LIEQTDQFEIRFNASNFDGHVKLPHQMLQVETKIIKLMSTVKDRITFVTTRRQVTLNASQAPVQTLKDTNMKTTNHQILKSGYNPFYREA
jgi:hypothetical protein